MTGHDFFPVIGSLLGVCLAVVLIGLYLRNIYKIYLDVQRQTYKPLTFIRLLGIPFFFAGIVLGMI